MKFSLIFSVLLLAPLASTEPERSATVKLLYDGNYVITESFDAKEIRHTFYEKYNYFDFYAKDNSSDVYVSNWIRLQGSPEILKSQSFAIETYYKEPDYDSNKLICKKNSDQHLRHLIKHCTGDLRMRALTAGERALLRRYKDEQSSTKLKYEVIYNKRSTVTKSAQNHKFKYDHY